MASSGRVEVPQVALGSQGLKVSKQGLGCMGMSAFYGTPKPDEDMIALMHRAFDLGVTLFDTADIYGPHTNEVLVGKAVKSLPRDKVQVATKFAFSFENGNFGIRGDADYVKSSCEGSLQRLGLDYIDLYYQHRVDTTVPIEVTVGAMKKLVEQGKVKYLGLSEASADTIRRAHAVHPISAVQMEWSLWSRDVEKDIVRTCRELGIGVVAYSPLGRGIFGGKGVVEKFEDNDWRNSQERFEGGNLERNKVFYERLCALAQPKGCTPAQLALAWVQHQGSDVVPIPGTTRVANLEANLGALAVQLSEDDMAAVAAAVPQEEVQGKRYGGDLKGMMFHDADTPPLETWLAQQQQQKAQQ